MTEDSFSRILYSISPSLPQQMNFCQINSEQLDMGRCRGAWELLAPSVSSASPSYVSLKESLESVRSHHFQIMLGTNSITLITAQNDSFPSSFSTYSSLEMKHFPYNQHVMQLQLNLSFPLCTRM